jgi:hypothetical protein
MSALEQVCSIPELVQIIIEQLEFDRSALYSAHLVNTTWAKYANPILWRNAPLSSLAAIEPSRQQHYANMIKISFSWNGWYPAGLDKLSFPSLERCLLDAAGLFDRPNYRRFLPPFFVSFPQYLDMWLKGADDPELVDAYWRLGVYEFKLHRRHAPRRRSVDGATCRSPWMNAPKLRSFLCASIVPEESTREALEHLASHGNYEELCVWYLGQGTEDVDSLLSKHFQRPIFPKLKHFGAQMPLSGAMGAMFAAFLPSTLSSIYIGVPTLGGESFQLLSEFKSLQSVTIICRSEERLMSSIRPLGDLHDLRSLTIKRSRHDYPSRIGWTQTEDQPFTDTDFAIMTSGLSLLEKFELVIPFRLSMSALTSLATNCPLLKTCNLAAFVPITAWSAHDHSNFPNLETLTLTHGEYGDCYGGNLFRGTYGQTKWSSPRGQKRPTMRLIDERVVDSGDVDIITRHCPKLSKLHLYLKDYGRDELEAEKVRMRRAKSGWLNTVMG